MFIIAPGDGLDCLASMGATGATGGEHVALAASHLQFHQGHARAPVAARHFMPALLRLARRDEGAEAPGVI